LEEYMKLWGPENYKDIGDVLKHDDMSVMVEIRKDAAQAGPRQTWARRIVDRKHHRIVYETGDNADQPKLQKTKRILKELQNKHVGIDFFLDDSPVSIYKLSIPGDQEEQQVEDLYIQEKNGGRTLLAHESAIISKVPKRVRTVRIFAEAEGGLLKDVRSEAERLGRNL
jgi:hypothetical protein